MKRTVILTVAVLAFTLSGCGNEDEAKKALADAQAQGQRIVAANQKQGQDAIVAAQADIKSAQDDAKGALDGIHQNISGARQRLRGLKGQVSSEQGKLSKLEGKVSGVRQQIAQNTFAGTGTFEVGTDVQPGVYRAAAQSGCYWARLASLDTSNINDNDNADGPVVLEITASDRAIQVSDCADFQKAG